ILLACLIPLDVGIRRVQLDWSVIRGWFGRDRKMESTETLGALLKLKERVRQTTDAERQRGPVSFPTGSSRPASPSTAKPKPAATEAPPEPEVPTTTTERLLAMKRKRQTDDKSDDTKP